MFNQRSCFYLCLFFCLIVSNRCFGQSTLDSLVATSIRSISDSLESDKRKTGKNRHEVFYVKKIHIKGTHKIRLSIFSDVNESAFRPLSFAYYYAINNRKVPIIESRFLKSQYIAFFGRRRLRKFSRSMRKKLFNERLLDNNRLFHSGEGFVAIIEYNKITGESSILIRKRTYCD